jgi:hypothetical protein
MKNKILNLKYLPDNDKIKLINYIESGGYDYAQSKLSELSIFINYYENISIVDYQCLTIKDKNLYYCRSGINHLGIFFDIDGKILPFSRYYLSNLNSFVEHIDNLLYWIKNNPITSLNVKELDGNYVACEKWFITYGHFQDECFNIYSAGSEYNLDSFTAFLDYPDDNECDTDNFKFNLNYIILDKLLFNNKSFNAHAYKNEIISLNKLVLIKNNFSNSTFHRFSSSVSNKLITGVSFFKKKIFLTRSKSYRDIENKNEIEYAFLRSGYSIINPESVTLTFLIKILSEADCVVLYWGSGMTNLVYCNPLTSIVILQSNSYAKESLEFWKAMMLEHNLRIRVISETSGPISVDVLNTI